MAKWRHCKNQLPYRVARIACTKNTSDRSRRIKNAKDNDGNARRSAARQSQRIYRSPRKGSSAFDRTTRNPPLRVPSRSHATNVARTRVDGGRASQSTHRDDRPRRSITFIFVRARRSPSKGINEGRAKRSQSGHETTLRKATLRPLGN